MLTQRVVSLFLIAKKRRCKNILIKKKKGHQEPERAVDGGKKTPCSSPRSTALKRQCVPRKPAPKKRHAGRNIHWKRSSLSGCRPRRRLSCKHQSVLFNMTVKLYRQAQSSKARTRSRSLAASSTTACSSRCISRISSTDTLRRPSAPVASWSYHMVRDDDEGYIPGACVCPKALFICGEFPEN